MSSQNKRLVITGGGTGGHIYPAIALIEYIKKKNPDTKMLFIGTKKGMENSLIPRTGIRYAAISASGFKTAKNLLEKLKIYLRFIFILPSGILRSMILIQSFKPDLVLGMGGYVCGPVFVAARILHKEIAIHEQNYLPGRLNRFFAKRVKMVFTGFEGSEKYFKIKTGSRGPRIYFSGVPVRSSIRDFRESAPDYKQFGLKKNRFTITAFGGSLGAEKLNNAVLGLYKNFRVRKDLQIILICGERFYTVMSEKIDLYSREGDQLVFNLVSYVNNMAGLYRITDLIISRAGATTVSEISVTGIPSILIPYPKAIENHQYYNAENLAGKGKAIIINDRDLSPERLLKEINLILENDMKNYYHMQQMLSKTDSILSEELIVEKMFGG